MASNGRGFPAKRTSMKLLGKVAAPKPINLPSQRSENNGADPNVELVPSGTHCWARPSSASNVLGSSTVDDSSGSTNRLSDTRPSTAGSDRTNESSFSAWGSNSRPSSASGVLPSNQTGISLLPCSAETRPGSSHLSRFAEPLSDNSVAWSGVGTVEKLGGLSSKNDAFSLTSGDFPSLGYEKNHSRKDPQDQGPHSRPGSSSSCAEPTRERSGHESQSADFNNWRKDGSPSAEDNRVQGGAERWQGAPQPYPCANNLPQHFDSWRPTPMGGPPGAVWFRGPSGAPPYQAPPGGFPLEPYPYYCPPQVPPPVHANSQTSHPQLSATSGHPPNVGEFYRPLLSDPYVHPGAPIRPGYFPAPVSYDGYYAPPAGYYNPNERNIPFMGITPGPQPPPYMGYSGQNNLDGKLLVSEQVESVHPHHKQQPSKVLLKHHNGQNRQNEESNWDHAVPISAPYHEEEDHMRWSSFPNDQESIYNNTDALESGIVVSGGEPFCQTSDNQVISSGLAKQKVSRGMFDAKAVDISVNKSEITPASSKPPQLLSNNQKDSSLIQKIEGLNEKTRASAGWHDTSSVSHRDYLNVETNGTVPDAYFENRTGTGINRSGDHRGGADLNIQGVGWQMKSVHTNTSNVVTPIDSETALNSGVEDHMSNENQPHLRHKDDGGSLPPTFDPTDSQREKMRELARLKAKQLEKEEEERIREQKAKARAMLEQLDRRTKAAESLSGKSVDISSDEAIHFKNEERTSIMDPITDSSNSKPEKILDTRRESVSVKLPLGEATDSHKESALPQNLPLSSQPDSVNSFGVDTKNSVSKQKQFGYKQMPSVSPEKSLPEVSIPVSHSVAVAAAPSAVKIANTEPNPIPAPQSSMNPKRKNNRFGKNKQKAEEASSMDVLPVFVPAEALPRVGKSEVSEMKAVPGSGELNGLKSSSQISQRYPLSGEDAHIKANNHWKPQPSSRKVSRNPQTDKDKLHGGDSVVWAPVRSQNKAEGPVDATTNETVSLSAHNSSPKNKRAEMERYVPKPVAKELAQQVDSQQLETPTGHMEFDVVATMGDESLAPAPAKANSSLDLGGGERRQNHPAKSSKSWRQRGSANSTRSETLQDGSFSQKPKSQEPQPDYFDEWDPPDGWNNPPKLDSDAASLFSKDPGAMNGGKRNPFRGQRVPGSNPDSNNHRNPNSSRGKDRVFAQAQSHAPNIDGRNVSKENHGGVSHWQPKSQSLANESGGWCNYEASNDLSSKHSNQVENGRSTSKQDDRRMRKSGPSKGRPRSPKSIHASDSSVECQQGFFPKNGNQNNRFGRQNMHYEYQPMNRTHNDNRMRSEKDSYGAHRITGVDRGERQSRRGGGNFHGPPQSCGVQGDSGYGY